MTALGHAPVFTAISVQTDTSILTLPQAGAPIITTASAGSQFVAYDALPGYYLVFLSATELPQQNLPGGGEFHWDGWIASSDVMVLTGPTQLEVAGVFPARLNIRNAPGTTGTSVMARTIDGKRYVATGNTQVADNYTWREFYVAGSTGWAIADNLTVIGGDTTPPHFAGVNLNNGAFGFVLNGSAGSRCVIEVSPNLTTWTPWSTNTLPGNGSLVITDPNPTTERFYRAFRLP